jgi:phosphatidylserine decarboxylase
MRILKKYILALLSLPVFSRLFGHLAALKFPAFIMQPIIKKYIGIFDINTDEIEKPVDKYKSLSSFFIRNLKSGARIIDKDENTLTSPVDCLLISFGKVDESLSALQIKGRRYSVERLLNGKFDTNLLKDGYYFQFYLSPKDYHHIHFPFDAKVENVFYSKGRLLPVNPFALNNYKELFSVNERITMTLTHKKASVPTVFIGAYNVGKIGLSFSDFVSNSSVFRKSGKIETGGYFGKKGDKLGYFLMGSTVVMFFPKETITPVVLEGDVLKMGQPFAKWL